MTHEKVISTAEQIENRDIRGSITIARVVANAMEKQAANIDADSPEAFEDAMHEAAGLFKGTRTAAVSLPNTLRYIFRKMEGETVAELRASAIHASRFFRENLEDARETLGKIGARRLGDGDTIMTHCHSTDALSVVKHALDQGKQLDALVKETRPRNQGHITAQRLDEWGVPVTVIVDNAAYRYLEEADHVLAGAHSIAADGTVVNSLGTSTLAVAANEQNVPVTIAAQTLKLHSDALSGNTIDVEMRSAEEVLDAETKSKIGDVDVVNPVSDITPPEFITAIVTERGQFPPASVITLIHDLYGEATTNTWDFEEGSDST